MNKNEKRENTSFIILVEDEEVLRNSLIFSLKRLGYQVLGFGSVEDALQQLNKKDQQNFRIILIITDLQLPGKSGLELVRTISREMQQIPVLVITGHRTNDVGLELKNLGVCDILDKPFDLDELVHKIKQILERTT